MKIRTMTRPALLVLMVSSLLGCGGEEVPEEAPVRPVRTLTVFSSGAERTRSFPGTAEAGLETRLSFKVAGTLEEIPVDVGDRVRAGELVAQIDPSDYELQRQDADAAVVRARATAREAAANRRRVEDLWENDNASKSDLDAAQSRSVSADASVESAEKNAELALSRLEYTRLLAPVDGAISAVRAEAGENVATGQTVAVLTAGGRPEVQVLVPEGLIGGIREGSAVLAAFDALPEERFPARITEVGVVAAPGGAAFPVRVRLDSAVERIRPGMAAEVEFRFGGDGRERLVVPAVAILQDRDGRYAFVVEETGDGLAVVHRRPVEIGEIEPQGLEIRSGLTDGDVIVTAGVSRLQDGQRVRLPAASPGGASSGGGA